jgi:hypothetical protein
VLATHHLQTGAAAAAVLAARTRAGQHLGLVPYGYRAHTARSTYSRAGSSTGAGPRLRRDPRTASVVHEMFCWRGIERVGDAIILGRLRADPDRYPPPVRGPGRPPGWTRGQVRHILANPVYTGHTVRGRTRGGDAVPQSAWITSAPDNHPVLVDPHLFDAAQQPLTTRERPARRRPDHRNRGPR